MAKKEKKIYRVERVDETQPEQQTSELRPMPMAEINGSGVALAFFILICAAGFTVYLLRREFSGNGIGLMLGCLVVAAILVAAVIGMIATTLATFRADKHRLRLVLTILSFFTALCIGASLGMTMPLEPIGFTISS